eukprot:161631_1
MHRFQSTVQRGAPPDRTPDLYGRTCASFGFIAKVEKVNSRGNLITTYGGVYEGQAGRFYGQTNNPTDSDYVWFSSILYGDCFPYWKGNWAKVISCDKNENG